MGLAVAAVAKRLGIAPATLRTWDRRYNLAPSGRTAGAHRRYTNDDIARLMLMRQLTLEGVAPADAAKAALEVDVSQLDYLTTRLDRPKATTSAVEEALSRPHLRALPGGGDDLSTPTPVPLRPPGSAGRGAKDLPGRVSAVVDAALAYDPERCDELLQLAASDDPATWWITLVEPAWKRVALRTVLGTPGELPEAVLATAVLRALRDFTVAFDVAMTDSGNAPANHPSRMRKIVLIFAAPDEVMPLAAHALAAALVAHGATARIATGPAGAHRSVELVTMVRPVAVVLATSFARPDLDSIQAVHDAFPELPMFVGLSSDDAAGDLPQTATVQRVRSFTGLLHEVLAVVES